MTTTQTHRTAREIVETLRPENPFVRFAVDANTESLIGYYSESLAGWYPIVSRTITGDWATLPYEILANGRRMIEVTPGNTWHEVPA